MTSINYLFVAFVKFSVRWGLHHIRMLSVIPFEINRSFVPFWSLDGRNLNESDKRERSTAQIRNKFDRALNRELSLDHQVRKANRKLMDVINDTSI